MNEELGCSTDASVDALMARGAVNASAKAKDANANETCVDMNDKEDEEEQGVGALGLKIYLKYFNAGKSKFQLLTYLSIFIISQIFTTLIEYWLALWYVGIMLNDFWQNLLMMLIQILCYAYSLKDQC